MARARLRIGALAVLLATSLVSGAASTDSRDIEWWFCPGPSTLDYLRLFERPEEWPRARRVIDVFKFYQQHTQTPAPDIVGPVTVEALRRSGAFSALRKWGIKTAIEVHAVKEYYCTADATGMNAAIADTIAAVRALTSSGGHLPVLAMDEPFVSGRSRTCGGPALDPTADRVAAYMSGVRAAFPAIQIGLIEAYPFSSASAIETMLSLLRSRNALPAFLHMDVDWHLSGPEAFKRDMVRLKAAAGAAGISFGIIITGYDGDADPLYAVDVAGITNLILETFTNRQDMPDHIIVQSWAESATGLRITPSNLPEDRAHTHTSLLFNVHRRLLGESGGTTGKAIPRRRAALRPPAATVAVQ
jgi:hypothetical protein